MNTAKQNKLKLEYEGSVKRVWQCPWSQDSLLFQFTDDYSVFDWGKMPDTIHNKGRALAIFGAFFFENLSSPEFWRKLPEHYTATHINKDFLANLYNSPVMQTLQSNGLASHFQGLVDEKGERLSLLKGAASSQTIYMQVQKAIVQRPQAVLVLNQNLFEYPPADLSAPTRLIPLEVVFRFGMPQGSSLKERLQKNPSYAALLGLKKIPAEGEMFERPVLEFYTKLEPKDRLLSAQEALLISGLNGDQFNDLVVRSQLACLALFSIFRQRGIELWDGKFEFVVRNGEILIADSIGPDELRLLYKETHLSKELIRQVYRGSNWEKSLKDAQKLANERCTLDWKGICINELKAEPQPFTKEVSTVINQLYGVLTNHVSEEDLFKNHQNLDEFVDSARILKR